MRTFLVFCLVTYVTCAPQYNYQQQSNFGQQNLGLGGGFSNNIIAPAQIAPQHQHLQAIRKPAPIVTKDVYIHSAPEEPEENLSHLANLANQIPERKHYRIIFIKAPAQSNKAAALRLAQAQSKNEEKTIIYVLSKKTDAADIQEALQQVAPTKAPSKPEVFFIKYKTQEEAKHAQQQIQAQYDALGGTSSVSDEGIAPVHSVIGSLGNSAASNHHQQAASQNFGQSFSKQSSSGYLPPARH